VRERRLDHLVRNVGLLASPGRERRAHSNTASPSWLMHSWLNWRGIRSCMDPFAEIHSPRPFPVVAR
jgi:hypothetical protein